MYVGEVVHAPGEQVTEGTSDLPGAVTHGWFEF